MTNHSSRAAYTGPFLRMVNLSPTNYSEIDIIPNRDSTLSRQWHHIFDDDLRPYSLSC